MSTNYLINNLINENMALRRDGTRLKLIILQIIEDLENTNDKQNEKYINWIKENCNLELYSEKDINELKQINYKRTPQYMNQKRMFENLLQDAHHSIEYYTILKIATTMGIDLNNKQRKYSKVDKNEENSSG